MFAVSAWLVCVALVAWGSVWLVGYLLPAVRDVGKLVEELQDDGADDAEKIRLLREMQDQMNTRMGERPDIPKNGTNGQ